MRLPLRRVTDFKKSLGFKVNALLIRRDLVERRIVVDCNLFLTSWII